MRSTGGREEQTAPQPLDPQGDQHTGEQHTDDEMLERHTPSVAGPRALLRLPLLRRLVACRLLGALGDGAFQGALAGAVLFSPERQSSAAAIAGGFAVLLLPYSILGPFAGALLDRWSRQLVVVVANLIRAGLVLGVALAVGLQAPNAVLFVAALFVTGTSRFVGSGLSASIPHTVPRDSLAGANSLATTVGSVATLVGGGVSFGLRALIGDTHWPIAIVTATVAIFYLVAAWVANGFSRRQLGPDETDEPAQPLVAVLQGLIAGLRHIVERPAVGIHIGVVVLVRFCFGLATLVVLLLFQHHFRGHGIFRAGVAGIVQVLGVSGAGLFLGAVTTAWFARRLGIREYLAVLLLVNSLVVFIAGTRFTEGWTMLTAFALAFGYQSAKVCADTVAQHESADDHVGRVFAVYDTGNNVSYVGAFALGVSLVPFDGRGLAAPLVIGAVYLVTSVAYWWLTAPRAVTSA